MKWVLTQDKELVNLDHVHWIYVAQVEGTEDWQLVADAGESTHLLANGSEESMKALLQLLFSRIPHEQVFQV